MDWNVDENVKGGSLWWCIQLLISQMYREE
jgi:hypothetical protein